MLTKPRMALSAVACGLAILTSSPSAQGEIPSKYEVEYSEAVLAYNGRKYTHAIKLLDELLKRAPQVVEFLELKALALKGSGIL